MKTFTILASSAFFASLALAGPNCPDGHCPSKAKKSAAQPAVLTSAKADSDCPDGHCPTKAKKSVTQSAVLTSAQAGSDCPDGHCSTKSANSPTRGAVLTGADGQNQQVSSAHFLVNEMNCGGCTSKVSKALAGVEGTTNIKLDAKSRSAAITFDSEKVTKAELVKAINSSGFKVSGERVTMKVSGMDCTSCEGKLERKLAEVEGLQKIETVSAENGLLQIIVDPAADTSAITKAIESLGYKAS